MTRSATSCSFSHFNDFIRELGLPVDRFLDLGRSPTVPGLFNMTRLALNGTRSVNGVSRIHGVVSSRLVCGSLAGDPAGRQSRSASSPTAFTRRPSCIRPGRAISITRSATTGASAFAIGDYWHTVEHIPDDQFWTTRQSVKARMLASVRERLQREYARKGLSPAQWRHVTKHLDPNRPDTLTIGFARRFATYKRAALLLRDRARLARLVNDPERPLLFLFAGKAHPADIPGQQVLREIKQLMLAPEFVGRVVFLEDYDLQLARWLVSGVDVWLNNPIAPLEASGTSGMKAAGQRRAESQRARRLVGGSLDAGQRLGHSAHQRAGPGAARCARSRADLRHARRRGGAALLLPQRRGLFAGVGASEQARDVDGDAALQHAARGVRLCSRACITRLARHATAARRAGLRRRSRAGGLEAARASGLAARWLAIAGGCALRRCRAASVCACGGCVAERAAAGGREDGVRRASAVAGVELRAAAADVV